MWWRAESHGGVAFSIENGNKVGANFTLHSFTQSPTPWSHHWNSSSVSDRGGRAWTLDLLAQPMGMQWLRQTLYRTIYLPDPESSTPGPCPKETIQRSKNAGVRRCHFYRGGGQERSVSLQRLDSIRKLCHVTCWSLGNNWTLGKTEKTFFPDEGCS